MMSFCPYITFTIVSLCQWNTIASYGKCLLVIRRCLKLYPVSMPVRCDIDLTVIFKSCRALYCLSIPIPFIMPNRLTGAPYLASRSFARLRPAFMLISFTLRTLPIFSIIPHLILFVKRSFYYFSDNQYNLLLIYHHILHCPYTTYSNTAHLIYGLHP